MKNWEYMNETLGESKCLEEQAIIILVSKVLEKLQETFPKIEEIGIDLQKEAEGANLYEVYRAAYDFLDSEKE